LLDEERENKKVRGGGGFLWCVFVLLAGENEGRGGGLRWRGDSVGGGGGGGFFFFALAAELWLFGSSGRFPVAADSLHAWLATWGNLGLSVDIGKGFSHARLYSSEVCGFLPLEHQQAQVKLALP
jgi:hypothetical protein